MEANVPQITWDSIQQDALIGSGGFGDVYKGTWLGTPVAIKQLHLKKFTHDLEENFLQEAKIMAKCNFPNVVRLFAVCLDPGHYSMIMEYMGRGSLFEILHNKDEPLSWKLRMQISIDIGNGLAYLHANKIIHRDLKSLNVLLDDNYRAKITDFGLAKIKLETTASTVIGSAAGTTRWRAPELFTRNGKPNPATDVYSFGMVLWELTTRKLPFADAPDEVTAGIWIKDGEKEEIPADCPVPFGQIVKDCWKESTARPSAAQLVKSLLDVQTDIEIATVKSWHFNPLVLKDRKNESLQNNNNAKFMLLQASQTDIEKVIHHYHHHPVSKMDIKSVKIIHNPSLSRAFELRLGLLQQRDGKAAFAPKWKTTENAPEQRQQIIETMDKMAAPYKDPDFPAVKLLPLWHGTRPDVLPVIFETGYVNLATTDSGFFGKGIYSAHEAEYAYRVYSKGSLVLNWVSTFSAYPTVHGDMQKLQSKGNFENYDSHFVPVIPPDGHHSNTVSIYHPCKSGQTHQYIEMVVFDSQQCLPRYLVELQPSFPLEPSLEGNSNNEDASNGRKVRPRSTAFYKNRNLEEPEKLVQTSQQQKVQSPTPVKQSYGPKAPTPADAPNPDSPEGLYMQGWKLFSDCQFKKALPFLEKAATLAYPPAYLRLSQIHATDGLVGPIDMSRSRWYQDQAAQKFNWFIQTAHNTKAPEAIFDAGCCFYYGHGTKEDPYTAFTWMKRAAEGGHTFAMYQLGVAFQHGEGVGQSVNDAMAWYLKASEKGNALAQINMGYIYRNHFKDYHSAMKYFQKAAEKELGGAFANIGFMYYDGMGMDQDLAQAVKWFTKAAEVGVVLAQVTLGELYENAHGEFRDVNKAAFWYKQAMMQGDDEASDNYHRLKSLYPWIK